MSVPYNIKPYDAGQVRRYRPSPRKGRPCPPEDLASFLYRIVMPSHPPATNARLAALRNGSRNADKIQTIPERNDGRIRNRMFLPLTHLGSRTNLRSGFSRILLPKQLLQPPKYLHPAKAVVESDCCRLQSRASDSTLFRYSTQKTGFPSFCDGDSDIERRPHEPERIFADIGDRFSIPFPAPSLGMFSGADRLDFPEKILILHNYDFVSSCRFVCITK